MVKPGYNDLIFINCPFDDDYKPMLYAIVYAIYRCGFFPLTALNEDDATDNRLDKIIRCIRSCRYGIHDISRIELNEAGFPRFNMPFELGLFYGAKKFGNKEQRNTKKAIVFEKERFTYQKYISDLSGIDTKAHEGDPNKIITGIRDWLRTASERTTIPGSALILRDYKAFAAKLPDITQRVGLDYSNIPFNDYCQIVEEAVSNVI
jgi:hypothetical protein